MESGDTGKIPIFEKLTSFEPHCSEKKLHMKVETLTDKIIKSFDSSCPSQSHVNIQRVILQYRVVKFELESLSTRRLRFTEVNWKWGLDTFFALRMSYSNRVLSRRAPRYFSCPSRFATEDPQSFRTFQRWKHGFLQRQRHRKVLRACPCKNRPFKYFLIIDCPNFFYTSQAIYAMNENRLYFPRFASSIFSRFFFYRQVENHTKNWNPTFWCLRDAC